MNPDLFVITPDSFNQIVLQGVKVLFLIGFFFYTIFAFVALRQIEVMRKTLITPFSAQVLVLGIFHLLLAVGLLLFAFVVLP